MQVAKEPFVLGIDFRCQRQQHQVLLEAVEPEEPCQVRQRQHRAFRQSCVLAVLHLAREIGCPLKEFISSGAVVFRSIQQPVDVAIRDIQATQRSLRVIHLGAEALHLATDEQVEPLELRQNVLRVVLERLHSCDHPFTVNGTVLVSLLSTVTLIVVAPAARPEGTRTLKRAARGCAPRFTTVPPKLTATLLPLSPRPCSVTLSPANAVAGTTWSSCEGSVLEDVPSTMAVTGAVVVRMRSACTTSCVAVVFFPLESRRSPTCAEASAAVSLSPVMVMVVEA